MKRSDVLKQKRASKIEEQGALLETRKAEKREKFTEEETTKFNDLDAEIRALDTDIKQAEAEEAAEVRAASMAGESVLGKDAEQREKDKMLAKYSLHKAIRSQLPNHSLTGVELEMHQELSKRAKEAGVSLQGVAIPHELRAEKRDTAQTVTQDSGGYGANLVAEDQRGVIPFLRPQPIIEKMGATYLRGLQGDLAFPVNNGGIAATWEGETDTVSPTKNAYGKKTMTPKRLASTVEISLQNILQSTPDLEAYTKSEMEMVIALKIDETAIEGAGSGGVPQGILGASGVNVVAGGTNGAAPIWGHIVDLETAVYVANANAARMGYLINPGTKGFLKKTKGDAADLAYMMGSTNEVNGYMVGVTNLMPNDLTKGTGTALNAAIFGDFSQLIIGEWGFFDMVVDNITRKKEGLIEITVNSFLDILVRQPKAFARIVDWNIS